MPCNHNTIEVQKFVGKIQEDARRSENDGGVTDEFSSLSSWQKELIEIFAGASGGGKIGSMRAVRKCVEYLM